MENNIRQKIKSTQEKNRDNLLVAGAINLVALTMLTCPFIVGNKMSNNMKLTYLVGGSLLSIAQVLVAENSKQIAALKGVYDKYIRQGVANEIVTAQTFDNSIDKIRAKELLVDVIDAMPDYKKPRYVHEFKLTGLVKPPQGTAQQAISSGGLSSTIQVKKALPVFDKRAEEMLDISWMSHDFFFRSAVVTGDEGSGKTALLAFICANIMAICPDVDLRIHNIQSDQDDDPWFPGMPQEIAESLFITDPQECLNDMLNVAAEMRRREIEKDRRGHPIIRVTDEFQGLLDVLGEDQFSEYVNAMIQIKNRGRKFARKVDGKDTGIRVIAGTHSLKQKMTKLDSGFFSGSHLICLGDSIKDSSTPFPSDFDIKKLSQGLAIAKAQLIELGFIKPGNPHEDTARPAVVRLARGNPEIKIIPRPDLTSLTYEVGQAYIDTDQEIESDEESLDDDDDNEETGDPWVDANIQIPNNRVTDDNTQYGGASLYPGNDYMEKLSNWYRAQPKPVTVNLIKQQLLILTQKLVSDEIVEKIINLLDQKEEENE